MDGEMATNQEFMGATYKTSDPPSDPPHLDFEACPIGAVNTARITMMEKRVDILERKIDWFMYLTVSTLAAVLVNIIITVMT